jgi:hypothetical protein
MMYKSKESPLRRADNDEIGSAFENICFGRPETERSVIIKKPGIKMSALKDQLAGKNEKRGCCVNESACVIF